MPITRRAAVDDWRVCRELRLRALREEPQAYASTFEHERRLTDNDWRDRLSRALTVLAFSDGQPVGMAAGLWRPDGDMMIVGMYVVPEARGQGCAGRLIDEIASAAIECGGRRLILDLAEGNLAAERCYRKYGFLPSGGRRPMERDPTIMEIRLVYPLPQPMRP